LIIVFILVLGGFLGIVIESKALDAGIGRLVAKMKGREIWIIPIVMFLFSVGGTTYGMGEETIALYPVIIPVLLAAGFDVLTAVMAILFVVWYALRVRRTPGKSPLFDEKGFLWSRICNCWWFTSYNGKRKAIMAIFMISFVLMIFSLIGWDKFGILSLLILQN